MAKNYDNDYFTQSIIDFGTIVHLLSFKNNVLNSIFLNCKLKNYKLFKKREKEEKNKI